jgi:stage II sporulation protein D
LQKMRRPFLSKSLALLLAPLIVFSSLALAQDAAQQTRPRRVAQGNAQWPVPPSTNPEIITTRLSDEPVMRIGLAANIRSVSISTKGQLLNASGFNTPPVPLATARVRLESHSAMPLPIVTDNADSADEIDGGSSTGSLSSIRTTTPSRSSSAATNPRSSFPSTNQSAASSYPNNVRTVARINTPTRELVAYANGSTPLLSSRAPIAFASDDELNAPVRVNDKSYRGRIEVFPNESGLLTVVNVIGLEDYVRGVVPNELSPGTYPALEALKAQAVAARTYAVRNRGQFASQGFDLLPTTRSQVYGGLTTEQPLSTRAVEETRGIVATYLGEPINALYTSTCGGRTEDAENIFNEAVPYLRGRECAPEGKAALAPFTIRTSRELTDIREEQNAALAHDAALLALQNYDLASRRLTDAWLAAPASLSEVRGWLASVAQLARQQPAPIITDEATRPPAFSTALTEAMYGAGRADTLLDNADVDYILAFRDAADIPARNRADVALLIRDGFLSLSPDGSLHTRETMSRARVIHTIARLLEARNTFQLQKGLTKPSAGGALVLRSSKGREQPLTISSDAYLFRTFGDSAPLETRSLALVGGEPVTFHVNARGEVDYLEAHPAPSGAASDRFSPFSNWSVGLTLAEAQARLSRFANRTGSLTDLRIASRGSSRRVTDLEIVGTNGTTHLRGGRIRSALGLREQLFVIDRRYDESGRLTGFTFTGRGWGHGVGMCQVGAYGLARAGFTYDRILKAYYSGIELTKMY